LKQRITKVVVCFCIARGDLQRLLELLNRFIHIAFLEQCVAKIVVGLRVVGINLQGLPQVENRFVDFYVPEQSVAEVVVRNSVVRCAGERMSPQRFAIPPICCLPVRAENQGSQNNCRSATQHPATKAPVGGQICRHPCQSDIQTNLRQISVTVRPRLNANLQNPDYRHQHSQKPEPAEQKIRRFTPDGNGNGRNDQ